MYTQRLKIKINVKLIIHFVLTKNVQTKATLEM